MIRFANESSFSEVCKDSLNHLSELHSKINEAKCWAFILYLSLFVPLYQEDISDVKEETESIEIFSLLLEQKNKRKYCTFNDVASSVHNHLCNLFNILSKLADCKNQVI